MKDYWLEIIWMLKNNIEYSHLHLWYSSDKGWCYCSYKQHRVLITREENLYDIKQKLKLLTK